jgi:hypothetical protein
MSKVCIIFMHVLNLTCSLCDQPSTGLQRKTQIKKRYDHTPPGQGYFTDVKHRINCLLKHVVDENTFTIRGSREGIKRKKASAATE